MQFFVGIKNDKDMTRLFQKWQDNRAKYKEACPQGDEVWTPGVMSAASIA
jgi:hypothetical protein